MPKWGVTTSEDVNTAVIRLKAKRLAIVGGDRTNITYICYTMDGAGLLPEIEVLDLVPREEIEHAEWYRLDLFKDFKSINDGKNIFYHPNIVPLDLCQTVMLCSIPPKGNISDIPKALEGQLELDVQARIKEEDLPWISMPNKWWTTEEDNNNTYNNWYCEWNWGDQSYLKDAFDLDPQAVQDMYGDNVQGFIEDNIKGIIIPTGCGQFGKYHINDRESNDLLNADWKENVAAYFPAEWSPPNDEDMDADYLSYGHEYRTVSPQVRFLYADTNNGTEIPKTDSYFRTWFIGS